MKVVFDTDVVLDVLLDREPFSSVAAGLFARVESGEMVGLLSATTINAISYLATRAVGLLEAKRQIGDLMEIFEVAAVDRRVLRNAQRSDFEDFEEAVLHQAALCAGAQAIVTRDPVGFRLAEMAVLSPEQLTLILEAGELLENASTDPADDGRRTSSCSAPRGAAADTVVASSPGGPPPAPTPVDAGVEHADASHSGA